MTHIKRFDHVGVTVRDLDRATDFFVGLGMEVEGRGAVEGDFVDDVCGIPGSSTEIVMLRCPGGGSSVELASFVRPDMVEGTVDAMSNELGLRSLGFEVEDIESAVAAVAEQGYGLVGTIGTYEDVWKQAYVRGPEGIIVSVAERIG